MNNIKIMCFTKLLTIYLNFICRKIDFLRLVNFYILCFCKSNMESTICSILISFILAFALIVEIPSSFINVLAQDDNKKDTELGGDTGMTESDLENDTGMTNSQIGDE